MQDFFQLSNQLRLSFVDRDETFYGRERDKNDTEDGSIMFTLVFSIVAVKVANGICTTSSVSF
jgi:hypothetical protein